jgi:hypothetical protein
VVGEEVEEEEEEVIMALRNGSYDGGFVAVGEEVEVEEEKEEEEEEAAAAMVVTTRVGVRRNLDGEQVRPLKLCIIGAGGFIGSHLCEKLMWDTHHSVLAVDVYGDKIQHLLAPGKSWSDRIEFYKINIKHDSRLEGLIKLSDLVKFFSTLCFLDFIFFPISEPDFCCCPCCRLVVVVVGLLVVCLLVCVCVRACAPAWISFLGRL